MPIHGELASTPITSAAASSNGNTRWRGTLPFLKEKVGSRLTIRPPTTTSTAPTTSAWRGHAASISKLTISGISASKAPAGAGTPVKYEPVQAGGGVSASSAVLKRASRSAEHMGNIRVTTQPSEPASFKEAR